MKVEFNIAKLTDSAKKRWFKTLEVHQILKSLEDSNLKPFILDKLPERPQIGSFYLITADKSNKKWKQDGYSYVKRNNGVGFREDVVYLKIAGVKEVMCSYSYMDHSLTDQTNLPNCRRIYKLVNATGDNTFYLVHYLNDKTSNEGSTDKTPPDIYMTDILCSNLSTSDEVSKSEGKQFEDEMISPYHNLVDCLEKVTESEVLEPAYVGEEKALNFISYFELSETGFSTNFFNEAPDNKFNELSSFTTAALPTNPLHEDNSNLGTINYEVIQNKFSEIENRLITLENDKPCPMLQPITTFPNLEPDTLFNIVDYSPEWDFTKGGAKVIICVNPLCLVAEAVNEKLKVCFGEVSVPGYFIQPGVLKCYAPPHNEGFVKLTLRINGEPASSNQGQQLFEYRKQRKPRTTRKVGVVDNDLGMTNEFKVRIVQKMREYDNLFGPATQNGRDSEHEEVFRKYSTTKEDEITDFNSFMLEADLLKILQFMMTTKPKGKENDFVEFLNKIDRHGYALIHYLCYLQYNSCLEFILDCGAAANTSSTTNVIPLEISFKLKNEVRNMLDILLSKGALGPKKVEEALRNTYADMPQADLDIASVYKDRNLLDMLLREVSLCDSINNSLSVAFPESENHSDESYLSFHDFLEEKFEAFDAGDFQFRMRRGCENDGYQTKEGANNETSFNFKNNNRTKRPRRYFRNYDKKTGQQKENSEELQKAKIGQIIFCINLNFLDPVIAADHQNEVKIIQKNVRGWLLRRQYLDILHATRVLQNYLRGRSKKKANGDGEPWDISF